VFAGRYRPSTFLTLTLDSYGRVDAEGAAVDPERYDYRRAARDAVHFPALVDRFWQNTRRCVGWDVQYFGTVEPQKRGAPHFHAAIRGAVPRAELRAITAATYHQVWWPAHDHLVYTTGRLPVWDIRTKGFTDPDTGQPLPTWEQACEELTEPAHVVRFGPQVHVKGILGGTEEAGRHVGYLTKYLVKSIGQAAGLNEHATDAQRDHAHRLHAELCVTPCSPRCPVWLLYGVQPKGARHSMTPGRCKGKAHRPEHLGIAGRRVLVSRKWSNKTVDDHTVRAGWTDTTGATLAKEFATKREAVLHITKSCAGGLRFHDLRHSYATWLVDDGVPVNMVQRVMGHERSSTTLDLYTRRTDDHGRILRALDDDDDVC
jgi:hypothetical protein